MASGVEDRGGRNPVGPLEPTVVRPSVLNGRGGWSPAHRAHGHHHRPDSVSRVQWTARARMLLRMCDGCLKLGRWKCLWMVYDGTCEIQFSEVLCDAEQGSETGIGFSRASFAAPKSSAGTSCCRILRNKVSQFPVPALLRWGRVESYDPQMQRFVVRVAAALDPSRATIGDRRTC